MPEINEVRSYADFLLSKLNNTSILEINILNGRYKKHGPFENYEKLKHNLPIKLLDVKTKGKFLYMIFTTTHTSVSKIYLFSTLGLSGGWIYKKNGEKSKFEHPIILEYLNKDSIDSYMANSLKHLNVEFKTSYGSMYFYDTLSFGTLKAIDNENELTKKLNTIGPDIMDCNYSEFKEQLTKKKNLTKVIGNVLMDQKIIAGIGNYLRADILWMCKISPFRKVNKLEEDDLKLLFHNAKVLTWGQFDKKKAIKMKILTKKDKMPSDYKRDFFVYNEDEDIHGNKVIKEELFEGSQKRFIYWVKNYQT
jgi:formamidopyrimidine-DNA glycosylase